MGNFFFGGGAIIHVSVFTDIRNNRFRKKVIQKNTSI